MTARLPFSARSFTSDRLAARLAARGVMLPSLASLAAAISAPDGDLENQATSAPVIPKAITREAMEAVPLTLAPAPMDAWEAMASAVAALPHASPRPARWWLPVAFKTWQGCCAYCGRSLALNKQTARSAVKEASPVATLDYLVPPLVGGPDHDGAVVLSCRSCARAKRGRDRMDFSATPDPERLARLRETLAASAWNHLAEYPAKAWTASAIRRVLRERWQFERFGVFVGLTEAGGFIAWRSRELPPAEPFHALRAMGAARLPDVDGVSGFWFGSLPVAIAAVWRAIGFNALARPIALGDQWPAPDLLSFGPRADWRATWPSVGGLVRAKRSAWTEDGH